MPICLRFYLTFSIAVFNQRGNIHSLTPAFVQSSSDWKSWDTSVMMNTYHSFRKSVAIFPRSGQGIANAIQKCRCHCLWCSTVCKFDKIHFRLETSVCFDWLKPNIFIQSLFSIKVYKVISVVVLQERLNKEALTIMLLVLKLSSLSMIRQRVLIE